MCECPGCADWRKKYGVPDDQPCTERTGRIALRMERDLCHYCMEAAVLCTVL